MISIKSVLQILKLKIDSGSTYIQRNYNEHGLATFKFHSPVKKHEILNFENQYNQSLPKEYVDFLSLHNGCELFMLEDDRGVILYSLEEVHEKTLESMEGGILSELQDDFWLIGEMNEGSILINRSLLRDSPESTYMEWCYAVGSDEIADVIGKNFKDFLKYLVISQGDMFWEWSTPDIEYNEEEEEDSFVISNEKEHMFLQNNRELYNQVMINIEYPYNKISGYQVEIVGVNKKNKKNLLSSFESNEKFLKVLKDILDELERWDVTNVPIYLVQREVRPFTYDQSPRREEIKYEKSTDFQNNPPQVFFGRI